MCLPIEHAAEDKRNALGVRVRFARYFAGLRQADLSEILSVKPLVVSRIETGLVFSVKTSLIRSLVLWAESVGISCRWLLLGGAISLGITGERFRRIPPEVVPDGVEFHITPNEQTQGSDGATESDENGNMDVGNHRGGDGE